MSDADVDAIRTIRFARITENVGLIAASASNVESCGNVREAIEGRARVSQDTMRVLVIDDNARDAELCLRALRRAGTRLESMTVENEGQLRAALLVFAPDVVLCDFRFPNFDGFGAQRLVRAAYPRCPLIFVSGAISEESAAMALQSGAVDYVMKSSLVRLAIAVDRAVGAARAAARVEERARWHVQRLEALWRIANDPTLRGQEISRAMLRRAACDLDPGRAFRGFLSCVGSPGVLDESDTIAESDSHDPREIAAHAALDASDRDGARTRGWVDVARDPAAPIALARAGWRGVITTQFDADGSSYRLTFASAEPAPDPFGDDDFAYVRVLATALANQRHVGALEDSLRDEEERASAHARRLEALWRIVNDASLGDAEKWLAMLAQAATSIRPDRGYRATLWRIEGDVMTLEAMGESEHHRLTSEPIRVGSVASSTIGIVLAAGCGTRSWDDVRATEPNARFDRAQGTRSCIVTTFAAGGATWALAFASGRVASKPLGDLEHAYLEVLASFFSNHVQQRWQAEQLRYQRSHDALTGLLSRFEFRSHAVESSAAGSPYAILIVDIDAFHEINESFGHVVGDALLVAIASALAGFTEAGEVVGRIAGDVFAIYVPRSPGRADSAERARAFASAFATSFSVVGAEGPISITRSASVGLASAPRDGIVVDDILSSADAALSVAKGRGRGSIVAYEAGMERDAHLRATLLNELAEAVATDQFVLYFQPHVEIATGHVAGCEALIRWNHPTRGLVSPVHFIPFAERAGIIASIDYWVMQNAFAAAAVLSASRPDFRLYFNLSGRQAGDPTIVRAFVEAARRGVPLRNIGVEITETDAMRDVAATHRVFRALRRLDVRIAIDDFGTGYSSLSSLKALSVDIVKIDRSFVSGVTTDADDSAIAKTIISIADHFGFDSLGEGAETDAEIDWLARHACRYVQGYAVSYPLPLEKFQAWMRERDASPGSEPENGRTQRAI